MRLAWRRAACPRWSPRAARSALAPRDAKMQRQNASSQLLFSRFCFLTILGNVRERVRSGASGGQTGPRVSRRALRRSLGVVSAAARRPSTFTTKRDDFQLVAKDDSRRPIADPGRAEGACGAQVMIASVLHAASKHQTRDAACTEPCCASQKTRRAKRSSAPKRPPAIAHPCASLDVHNAILRQLQQQ